ncbi:unnamed protein product [Trichobilharzia szidati]|nr:unnamed protein product [Trichobilharzia szidati]
MPMHRKQKALLMANYKHHEECMEKRLWGVFFGISLGCFFGGIIIILLYRILIRVIVYLQNKSTISTAAAHHSEIHTTHPSNEKKKNENFELNSINKNNRFSSVTLEKYDQQSITTLTPHNNNNQSLCSRCSRWWTTTIQLAFIKGRWWAIRLVSYDWIPGRMFIALSMIFSLTSFSIYAYEATVWPLEIEKCGHKGRRLRLLDFAMNIFFLLHFIVRLIASSDALIFWIEWYSILDYLTVPPTLVGFFIKRTWIGFRFVRIFRLCNLPEVLNNLNVIKSASSLRMCQLCTLFISIWFAGAGCFHLFENTGNLFGSSVYNVSQPLAYTASLYFTIVTMSTVGYGDIVPQTYLGRAFISLFILFALATFASAIPEIVDMFFNVSKYSGVYKKREGKSHIVVCGDITTDSVRTFLNDFLHEDRQISDVEVVFINRSKPDLQLENLLRLHFLRVKYFRGTVMDHADLQRVKMESADACLILASATTVDPHQTDAENIMRVIAVKNFASHVRVIVQLLQTENKAYLLNSPYWNWDSGDEIVCFSELKLGFLAQSCIAPGFSTLVTNLFTMHSIRGLKEAAKFAKIYVNQPKAAAAAVAAKQRSSIMNNKSPSPQANALASTSNSVVLRRPPTSTTKPLTTTTTADSRQHCSQVPSFSKEKRKSRKWLSKLPRMVTSLFKPKDSGVHHHHHLPATDSRPNSMQYSAPTSPKLWDTESAIGYQSSNALTLLDSDNWVYNYLQGASMEIYSAKFSMAFDGLHFTDAAILCRKYLDLLLIAVVAKIPENKDPQLVSRISGDFASPGGHINVRLQDDDEGGEDGDSNEDEDDDYDENGDNYDDEDMNENKYYLAVSPTLDKNVIINYGSVGFFICDSQENANKVSFYCLTCHVNNNDNSSRTQYPTANIKPCSCQLKSQKSSLKVRASALFKLKRDSYYQSTKSNRSDKEEMLSNLNLCPAIPELEESEKTPTTNSPIAMEKENEAISGEQNPVLLRKHEQVNESTAVAVTIRNRTPSRRSSLQSAYDTEEHYHDAESETQQPRRVSDTEIQSRMSVISPANEFDITGMYYYCKYQKFEDKLITSNSSTINKSQDLYNHILVCILAEPDAPLLGLHSFVMPLRASNYHSSQLRTIVFLGDKNFLQREWCNIANFPKVYTLAGSPLSRADLRAAHIQYASVCVILSSRGTIKLDDPYMLDKEVILCTLNIRAMKFATFSRYSNSNIFSKNIKRRSGAEIPLITELMTDNNIHYLDPDHSGGVQITASLTAPFARGIAFTSSVLDVLASTAYFDRNSMTLIRHLVTGGVTPALEQWLAEGGGLIGFHDWQQTKGGGGKRRSATSNKIQKNRVSLLFFPGLYETRQRPRIEQIPLIDPRLLKPSNNDGDNNSNSNKRLFRCYGDLFCHAIREHGILCLGIYRLSCNPPPDSLNRLVTVPSCLRLDTLNETLTKKHSSPPSDNQKVWNSEFGVPPPRRLSTCALPVDRMLRKHSLQANRKSLSVEENSPEPMSEQQQQKLQDGGQNAQQQQQKPRNISSKKNTPLYSSPLTTTHHQKFLLEGGASRYVISNPPNHFQLYRSDLIFCLCPFECAIPI